VPGSYDARRCHVPDLKTCAFRLYANPAPGSSLPRESFPQPHFFGIKPIANYRHPGYFLSCCFLNRETFILDPLRLPPRLIFRPIFRIWAVLLLLALGLAVYHGWHNLSLPFNLDYGEGPVMWQAANILDPRRAYAPLDTGQLVIWNYPPAYLLLARSLSGIQGDLLWSGRFLSFLSGLGITALLTAIIWRALPRRLATPVRICAAATGCFFLCVSCVVDWFSLMRVDFLGLFAVYLGVFLFLSFRSTPWKSYLAFLCFVFAILTKQTYIAAPLACFIVALVLAPARAFRLVLMSVSLGAFVFWFGMHRSNGGFIQHLLTYNVHKFILHRALGGLWEALMDVRLLFLPLVALIVSATSRQTRHRSLRACKARIRRSPFLLALTIEALHFLFALALSFTYGKVGANVNYFLEWNAALCVLAGLCIGMLLKQAFRSPRITIAVAAAFAFPVVLAFTALNMPLRSVMAHSVSQSERKLTNAYRELLPILAVEPGPVLSDDMVLVLRAGKDVVFEPATMNFIAEAGTWDQSAFLRRVHAREFPLIVLSNTPLWHPRVLEAILQNYQSDRVVGPFHLYRPRAF